MGKGLISQDAPGNGGIGTTSRTETPLRGDRRYSASEVLWLRRARFKYGADVQILDISANGIRITHYDEIAIGAPVVFQFSTDTGTTTIQARVIHCRDVEMNGWIAYEIGCRFVSTLPLFSQDRSDTPACEMFDLLDPLAQVPNAALSRREPLWVEHMIASCGELGAGVCLAVTLVLVLAEWAARLLSK